MMDKFMKKFLKIILPLISGIMLAFSVAGCAGAKDQTRDPVEELSADFFGAYFITDKSGFWCVIADNKITISMNEDTVYDISIGKDSYQGNSITKTISFWFKGDILYLNDNNETIKFKKDSSYQRAEAGAVALGVPKGITVNSGGEGLNFVTFQWAYQSDYGRVGAAIEIKKLGSKEYKALNRIDRVYMNTFVVQLDKSQFEVGENWVRIYHIGGPSITNDHRIIVNKNSDYATYCVTLSDNGSVDVK